MLYIFFCNFSILPLISNLFAQQYYVVLKINHFMYPCLKKTHIISLLLVPIGDLKVLVNSEGKRIEWKYLEKLHQECIKNYVFI